MINDKLLIMYRKESTCLFCRRARRRSGRNDVDKVFIKCLKERPGQKQVRPKSSLQLWHKQEVVDGHRCKLEAYVSSTRLLATLLSLTLEVQGT